MSMSAIVLSPFDVVANKANVRVVNLCCKDTHFIFHRKSPPRQCMFVCCVWGKRIDESRRDVACHVQSKLLQIN